MHVLIKHLIIGRKYVFINQTLRYSSIDLNSLVPRPHHTCEETVWGY